MTKLKICGLRRIDDIAYITRYPVDFAGFILTPGRREVSQMQAAHLIQLLPSQTKAVGVFRDESAETIRQYCQSCLLDIVQLHASFDLARFQAIRNLLPASIQVWQTIHIAVDMPAEQAYQQLSEQYLKMTNAPIKADAILFDASLGKHSGGLSQTFDWLLLKQFLTTHIIASSMVLAGGITAENAQEAINMLKPDVLDCSSGVEESGKKQLHLIAKLQQLIYN